LELAGGMAGGMGEKKYNIQIKSSSCKLTIRGGRPNFDYNSYTLLEAQTNALRIQQ